MNATNSTNQSDVKSASEGPLRRLLEALAKTAPELKAGLSELLSGEAENAKERSQALSAMAAVLERILLLAAGTFVLSLNFTAAAADQLHRYGLASQLSTASHVDLYLAWGLLLAAIFACSVDWILTQLGTLKHERLRQFSSWEKQHQQLWSLVRLLGPAIEATPTVGDTTSAVPETSRGAESTNFKIQAILSRSEQENLKAKAEIEKREFPAKTCAWLICLSLICVPSAFLLLLAFAIRATSLLLR